MARTIENYANGVWTATEPITDRISLPSYDGLGRTITTTLNYAPGATASGINRVMSTRYDDTTGRQLGAQDVMGTWSIPQYDVLGRSVGSIQNCTTSGGVPQPSSCATYTATYPDRNVPGGTPHFDALGRAFETVNAAGTVTRTTYDGLGRATGTIQNYVLGGPTTAITNVTSLTTYHDASGHTTSSIDPTGVVVTQTMVLLTQTTIMTDGAGLVSTSGGDGTGATRWSRGPDGAYTVTLVDGLGRPVQTIQNYENGSVTTGDGVDRDLITTTVYDRAGRRRATMDPLGRITRFGYNGRSQLTRVVENELDSTACTSGRTDCNLVTTYRYDRAGNQIKVTDARNLVIRQAAYNAAGAPITTTDALGAATAWTYNARGQVVEQVLSGVPNYELTTQYDALGRIVSQLPNGPVGEQRWTYDKLGRPVTSYDQDLISGVPTTPTGVFTTTYDPLGQVQTVQSTSFLSYAYDAAGRRTMLNPDVTETNYSYDSAGRPDTVIYGVGTATMADYGYDSAGRLHTTTNVDGSVTTTTYDAVGRSSDLHTVRSGNTVTRFQYAYDRAGQRTQLIETVNGTTRTLVYAYDGVGRLTAEAVVSGTTTSYTYDKAGNRLSVAVNSTPVQTFTYNAASHVTTSGWSYDERGNLETDGTNTYMYDGYGRLSSVTTPGGTSSFRYMGEVLQRITATGQPTVTLVQDTSQGLSKVVFQTVAGAGDTAVFHGSFGEYLGTYNGGARPALKDALGTVREVVTDSGSVVDATQYSAWGEVQSGDAPDPYGFTGEYTDATSGLVYLRARWYNPKTGTLLGRDPFAGDPTTPYSLSPYQYGYSNPLSYTDPSGNHPDPSKTIKPAEGTWIGMVIAMDFERESWPYGVVEFRVPGASKKYPGVRQGYVDFAHTGTGEAYEVKSYRNPADGIKDIGHYLEYLNAEMPASTSGHQWIPGESYAEAPKVYGLWPIGIDPTYNPITDGYYIIVGKLAAPGVITYESLKIPDNKVRDYAYDPVAVDAYAQKWLYYPEEPDPDWRYRDRNGNVKFPQAKPIPLPDATFFVPSVDLDDVTDNFNPRPTIYVCVAMMAVIGAGGGIARNYMR